MRFAFERWLELFSDSVDEAFGGTRAEHAKMRGQMIARRMQEYLASCHAATR
ncbi:MAG: hypothetical protein ACXW28_12930 [Thermoanaerobaculia bacterium]